MLNFVFLFVTKLKLREEKIYCLVLNSPSEFSFYSSHSDHFGDVATICYIFKGMFEARIH
jgi:hypothetical protein